jgi:hypothetical protein
MWSVYSKSYLGACHSLSVPFTGRDRGRVGLKGAEDWDVHGLRSLRQPAAVCSRSARDSPGLIVHGGLTGWCVSCLLPSHAADGGAQVLGRTQ